MSGTGPRGSSAWMRAAVLRGRETLEVTDVPRPTCPDDGLLLKVAACAVCGSDVRLFLGRKSIKGAQRIGDAVLDGHIIGHEIAGTIHAVGKAVTQFAVGETITVAPSITCGACDACRRGDTVVCRNYQALGYQHPGGFAECLAVPGRLLRDGSVNRVPAGIPPWQACLAEPLACALNAQAAMGIGAGDSLLISGAGPMGCLHLLLARQRGAGVVAVAEPHAGRRDRAARLGADLTVDPFSPDAEDSLLRGVQGRGYTSVIFAVSSIDPVRRVLGPRAGAYPLLAPGARLNLFAGLDPGDTEVPLDVRAVHYQGLHLLGSVNSTPQQNAAALHLICRGDVDVAPVISARLPLADTAQALRWATSPDHLKIVIEPWGDR